MSKTTKTVLIVTAIFIACLIGVGIIFGVAVRGKDGIWNWQNLIGGERFAVDELEVIDLDDVSALSIDCTSGDIQVVVSDETKVTLKGAVISNQEQEKFLKVSKKGNTLYVEVEYENRFWNIHTDMDLTLYLPSDNMLDLTIDSTSGNIEMANMRFGDVKIDKTSGDTKILDCEAKSMNYDSSSGNTEIASSDLGSMKIVSTSGDIEIMNTPGDITIRSTSGNVDIKDADGALDIGSTSGDVTIDFASIKISPISVSITSGNIRLYMHKGSAFNFDAKTTSGNISSDLEISISGKLGESIVGENVSGTANGGGELVSLNTVSGNIEIKEK